jgi:hypothetical protein
MITPPPRLDTVTLRPAPSDTVTIRPTYVYILWPSDPQGLDCLTTPKPLSSALQVGLNVGCDNPTQVQFDPFSAPPGGGGYSSDHDTQMALLKNGAAPPERTSPTYGSAERKLDLIWPDPPNRAPPKHGSMVACWVRSTIPRVRLGQRMGTTLHAAVVSHHQGGLIVTSKTACAGWIVTVTSRPPRKPPGRKIRSLTV